jgi:hypothetical protein
VAKPKFDPKDFLLRRGETLVLGVAGFFLVLLLVWGVRTSLSAMNPEAEAQKLTAKATDVNRKIDSGEPDEAALKALALPGFLKQGTELKRARVNDFQLNGNFFDPTAQPNTKRENPTVLTIGDYQADLVLGAMPGYDMYIDDDGEVQIAVFTMKTESKLDTDKLKKVVGDLSKLGKLNQTNRNNLNNSSRPQTGPGGPGTTPTGGGPGTTGGGFPGGGFPGGPGRGGPGRGGPGRGGPGMGIGGSNPHGLQTGEFDAKGQRNEKAIKYIPIKELDAALRAGNLPATTVIPQRLVIVQAVVPLKKQLDELKRALRLPNPTPATAKPDEIARADAEARRWGPWYDGYEVQRRETRVKPNGEVEILQDWPDVPADPKDTSGNYKFEETFIDKIYTRKIADTLEEGYMPYFLKPDLKLVMPLPRLAKDLNVRYPEVKLKDIVDNIDRLKKADKKELSPSDLLQRLSNTVPPDSIYGAKTGDGLESSGNYGNQKFGPPGSGSLPAGFGPGLPGVPGVPGGPGAPKPPAGYGDATHTNDVDNYLLRFIDSDVVPGHTYEYRIRLRMWNPNYGQDALVANPEFAKESYKLLHSKWLQLLTAITVPAESFLYAYDVKTYFDQTAAAYPSEGREATAESKRLNALLQVKDYQAVVQVATWMEQVKAGDGLKREPVGAWVVAEMPVGRGQYVGRKQFVKLPLWSSETQQYVFRELVDKVVKGNYQPKGWVVDFSTKSVLVDFDGGKVKTKSAVRFDAQGNLVAQPRAFEEDVATELLIVRPDGKLVVRSSLTDDADANRKAVTGEWAKWVKEVENHKPASDGKPEANPFDPKR